MAWVTRESRGRPLRGTQEGFLEGDGVWKYVGGGDRMLASDACGQEAPGRRHRRSKRLQAGALRHRWRGPRRRGGAGVAVQGDPPD